jgi:hypothetical protein
VMSSAGVAGAGAVAVSAGAALGGSRFWVDPGKACEATRLGKETSSFRLFQRPRPRVMLPSASARPTPAVNPDPWEG